MVVTSEYLVRMVQEIRHRECDLLEAQTRELTGMARQLTRADDCGMARALRSMAPRNRVKALELQGKIAALAYEHGRRADLAGD